MSKILHLIIYKLRRMYYIFDTADYIYLHVIIWMTWLFAPVYMAIIYLPNVRERPYLIMILFALSFLWACVQYHIIYWLLNQLQFLIVKYGNKSIRIDDILRVGLIDMDTALFIKCILFLSPIKIRESALRGTIDEVLKSCSSLGKSWTSSMSNDFIKYVKSIGIEVEDDQFDFRHTKFKSTEHHFNQQSRDNLPIKQKDFLSSKAFELIKYGKIK